MFLQRAYCLSSRRDEEGRRDCPPKFASCLFKAAPRAWIPRPGYFTVPGKLCGRGCNGYTRQIIATVQQSQYTMRMCMFRYSINVWRMQPRPYLSRPVNRLAIHVHKLSYAGFCICSRCEASRRACQDGDCQVVSCHDRHLLDRSLAHPEGGWHGD